MDSLLYRRFIDKVIKYNNSSCYGWKGYISKKGYGYFWFNNTWTGAHIVSYLLHNNLDRVPDGKQILHKCDNKVCTNPKHLYLGTPSNNICDRYERANKKFITKPYKIDNSILHEIYNLYSTGTYTYEELSNMYNIPKTTIFRSLKRSLT